MSKLKVGDMYDGGMVYCIYLGYALHKLYPDKYTNWDKLYPEWKDKEVYYLKFTKPIRQVSFEEFCEKCPYIHMIKDEFKQEYYNGFVEPIYEIALPEDAVRDNPFDIDGNLNE